MITYALAEPKHHHTIAMLETRKPFFMILKVENHKKRDLVHNQAFIHYSCCPDRKSYHENLFCGHQSDHHVTNVLRD